MSFMETGDGGYGANSRGHRSRGRNQRTTYNSDRNFGGRYGSGPADSYQQGGRGGRSGGFYNQSYSSWDGGPQQSNSYQSRPGGSTDYRGRGGGRTWGRNQGGRGRGRAAATEPQDIEFLGLFSGGSDAVTALVLDGGSSLVYTGSKDGNLRTWACTNPSAPRPQWKCSSTIDMGGVVDSLLLEGGFMFVGMHARGQVPSQQPGVIKVCHLESGSQHTLEGHQGQVLALAAAAGMLFSGGQDHSIRAWKLSPATNSFELGAVITAAQGGHDSSVCSLSSASQFLFSAGFDGTIKVWDMASGTCTQTLSGVHSSAVVDMLFWENHLLSGSLDGTVKVWAVVEAPAPGAVLEKEPMYTHMSGDSRVPPVPVQGNTASGGILKMAGAVDSAQNPVLLTSHVGDSLVRLWELPTFADRGELRAADARALAAGLAGLIFTGDRGGTLKVWRWKAGAMPVG